MMTSPSKAAFEGIEGSAGNESTSVVLFFLRYLALSGRISRSPTNATLSSAWLRSSDFRIDAAIFLRCAVGYFLPAPRRANSIVIFAWARELHMRGLGARLVTGCTLNN